MLCIEGPDHLWAVECQVCLEHRHSHERFSVKLNTYVIRECHLKVTPGHMPGCTRPMLDVHPNWGNKQTWSAPFGEEHAARIALDHLSRLGFVPNRLMTATQARSTM